jgi:hypothetical protein
MNDHDSHAGVDNTLVICLSRKERGLTHSANQPRLAAMLRLAFLDHRPPNTGPAL